MEDVMLAKIYVTLKKGVHDPQGEAVAHALTQLGHREVAGVRVGKYIEVTLGDVEREAAERRVTEMCEQLLANPVIESYRFELAES